jgi:hypothetical protein
MFKRLLLTALCALTLTVSSFAQQGATIVMRSGERISGSLVDYGASGFAVSVNGQMRNIPANQVAAVEFNGRQLSPDQQAKLNAGQPFLVLNDGQTIDGRLYDIGGTTPLRITVESRGSGRRDFNSTDVAALYMGNRGGVGAAGIGVAGGLGTVLGSFRVPANQQWTPTNITVNGGETLGFQASGEIHYSPNPADLAVPGGSTGGRRVPRAPIQTANAGALIGRVGTGAPFAIGNQTAVRMPPTGGQLFLGINDDNVGDNNGEFQVTVSR